MNAPYGLRQACPFIVAGIALMLLIAWLFDGKLTLAF